MQAGIVKPGDLDAETDRDSLHILPLGILPLHTPGLAKARLIKNARLDGVVELFSGKETGSGQIAPDELPRVFQFDQKNRGDIALIKSLSELSSYDVYSLRLELRRLGIAVDEAEHLRLSEAKAQELADYMTVFTRPLVRAVFGDEGDELSDLRDLPALFARPDLTVARRNLGKISQALGIDLEEIPAFLEDYGDIYLSLAYYQYCFDENLPKLQEFHDLLDQIRGDRKFKTDRNLQQTCDQIDGKLRMASSELANILDMFRAHTVDMWDRLPTLNFHGAKRLITRYQTKIGGALCAMSVKLRAWVQRFPQASSGNLSRRAEFIMSDIRQGIERIPIINFSMAGA